MTKGNLSYKTASPSFRADVSGTKGPTPGSITVSIYGTDVSLAQLTVPGLCHLKNVSTSGYVTYGPRDPDTGKFFPFGKLLPGEGAVLRLAGTELGAELTGTGTDQGNSTFHMRSYGGSNSVVEINAFEE